MTKPKYKENKIYRRELKKKKNVAGFRNTTCHKIYLLIRERPRMKPSKVTILKSYRNMYLGRC